MGVDSHQISPKDGLMLRILSSLQWLGLMGICSLIEWLAIQMPSSMVVGYSDHYLVNGPVFRPPFDYRSAIQMPGTSIWIANHLNNEQVKVCYSDVSAIQMFAIQIPSKRNSTFKVQNLKSASTDLAVLCINKWTVKWFKFMLSCNEFWLYSCVHKMRIKIYNTIFTVWCN